MSRRGILAAAATAAGAAVLVACSGGSTDSGDGSGADVGSPPAPVPTTASPSSGAVSTGAASTGAASTAAASSPASGAPAGKSLVALDTLEVGASKAVTLANGRPGIVTRTGTATAVCFSAICTHMGCTVKPAGERFDCPCHGSTFDARTGKVLGGPAPSPLPTVAVAISGGGVVQTG